MGREVGGLFVKGSSKAYRDRSESRSHYQQMFCNHSWLLETLRAEFPGGSDLPECDKEGHSLEPPNHCPRPISGIPAGSAFLGTPPGPRSLEDYLDGHINLAGKKGTEISGKLLLVPVFAIFWHTQPTLSGFPACPGTQASHFRKFWQQNLQNSNFKKKRGES